jgi:acyl-CoA thioesterase
LEKKEMEGTQSAANVSFMMRNDAFSQWLGIEILEIGEGYCKLTMQVRPEMTNGFGIAHGGICFSLADTCLAFAANSYGKLSLTLSADIAWPEPVGAGDVIFAESRELVISEKSAAYDVTIWKDERRKPLALFRGMVHRSGKPVIPEIEKKK